LIDVTLQSILAQSHHNLELIVVDDGSTDATAEAVGNIKDPRLQYFVIPHAGRPAVPRNYGIRLAKGLYIGFCDDDDLWTPYKLEKQVAVLEDRIDLFMVCTNVEYLPDHTIMKKMGKNETIGLEDLLFGSEIVNSSILMRRSVIGHIGYLDEDIRIKASEDYDYWCRLLAFQDRSVLLMKEAMVSYRRNTTDSISSLHIDSIDDLTARVSIIHNKFATKFPDLIRRATAEFEYKRSVDKNRYKLFAGEIRISDIWKNPLLSLPEKCRTTIIWGLFLCYKMSRNVTGSHWKDVEQNLAALFHLFGMNIKSYLVHFGKFY
jgi:glycosyltransferase involved in cell wall biosynthesis